MNDPLVSIICLCHNQATFVKAAIQSVWNQTYKNIQLIVVDDGSTDGSKDVIKEITASRKILFINLEENMGNCAAFNRGLEKSKGLYIIDLAADDILLPPRVELGVHDFLASEKQAGVHFCDAFLINEQGKTFDTHYHRDLNGDLIQVIPEGNIYEELIRRYFICPPTMMIKRTVLEELNGYDENLSYEDFDFWIRSSRNYQYLFNKAPLVKKREVKKSLGSAQFAFRSLHLQTTFSVCEKAFHLNRTRSEDKALKKRINYEIKQCLKTFNFGLIPKYTKLKKALQRRLSSPSSMDR